MASYLTSKAAAHELGVSVTTLYAYVSRGLIRSEEVQGSTRERRYLAEDVRQLKLRKEQRRQPQKAVEGALSWGAPILESSLSQIVDGKLYYRGQEALALALTASFEAVAHLLWTGTLPEPGTSAMELFSQRPDDTAAFEAIGPQWQKFSPLERFLAVLPLVAPTDLAALNLQPPQTLKTGAKILQLLGGVAIGKPWPLEVPVSLAGNLQRHWAPGREESVALFDMALVLCADHELNSSSFTARCVASTGATLYAAVMAGLCALQGVKHGGNTERVTAFLDEIAAHGAAGPIIARYLRRGDMVPGFGHSLYPDGDPRAQMLLEAVRNHRSSAPDSARSLEVAQNVESQVWQLLELRPNIDFALVVLSRFLRLPPGAPLGLFALGRTVGWIAHAREQYAAGTLIRPRARYVNSADVS